MFLFYFILFYSICTLYYISTIYFILFYLPILFYNINIINHFNYFFCFKKIINNNLKRDFNVYQIMKALLKV